MDKNIKTPLFLLIGTGILFCGIIVGMFIGRITNKDANSPYYRRQHTEKAPSYTYPYMTGDVGKINVNSASADELTMLPGIGDETAKRIVEYRTKYGRFFSLDELSKVKGIGENTIKNLRPYATVGEY